MGFIILALALSLFLIPPVGADCVCGPTALTCTGRSLDSEAICPEVPRVALINYSGDPADLLRFIAAFQTVDLSLSRGSCGAVQQLCCTKKMIGCDCQSW